MKDYRQYLTDFSGISKNEAKNLNKNHVKNLSSLKFSVLTEKFLQLTENQMTIA